MQISIADLLELEAYIAALATRVDGFTDYAFLGQGEDFNDAIQSYYNNKYDPETAGITLFLGIFESFSKDGGGNNSFAPVYCQACVLMKADPSQPREILTARNTTWKAALNLIGRIEKDMEDSRFLAATKRLRIEVAQDKLIPLERVANVNAWGWGAELVFNIPVNSIKYA
jgi:hypothetical protein